MSDTSLTLGKWVVVEYAVNISSLVASALVLLAILIGAALSKHPVLSRPTLRLHITQAACTLLYALCRILAYHNVVERANEQTLRAFLWMSLTFYLCTQLISTLICVHVFLTVVTRRVSLVHRIQKFFEITGIALALLVAHPVMYAYRDVQWNTDERMAMLDGKWPLYAKYAWAVQLAWVFAAIVGSLVAAISVYSKTGGMAKEMELIEAHVSFDSVEWAQNASGAQTVNGIELCMEVHRMAMRVSMHALMPLVSGIWLVICALAPHHGWIYGLAMTMAASQGVVGMVLLLVNPALDQSRDQLLEHMREMISGKHVSPSLHLDFSKLDNTSTICLSPYQSHNNSSSNLQDISKPSAVL
ncbi:hypothetical protein GGI15_004452 [Coemansia interrupta]|uniref:Uncharacterized protein n=1 Tax=Coemansia interrupta TaxID=1126814 RepID=A0A9W8LEW3_9FUNG|nr:hypothetical protein GGI15_004452 [Coemansia interrupta]